MKFNVFILATVCLAATKLGATNINPAAKRSAFESFMEGTLKSVRKNIQDKDLRSANECLNGARIMLAPQNSSVFLYAGGTKQAIRNYRVRMRYLARQIKK